MYAENQLKNIAQWCTRHRVHLVITKIYGCPLIDTSAKSIQQDYQEGVIS
jgi:hypothetical protein